ncbi:MAG: aminoglycoside phosphotransferase family protein [Actinomycetia bacterium]|nr:aminoglycoside phosphotransferase family protein [Actinomycetes bacterium]
MSGFAEARARRALDAAGLDMGVALKRADSVTNEVFLTDTHVVRINRRPNQRLRREALLGPRLPASVKYPKVVAYGGRLGADWLIVERCPGEVLSRCWPLMSIEQRQVAVIELARMLRELHQTEAPGNLPAIDAAPQLINRDTFSPVMRLLVALDKAHTFPHVERDLVSRAEQLVIDTSEALLPYQPRTLIHGDLHFENLLWDGSHITALLDFEWARMGPPDLDLDVLLRFCAYPYLHVAEDYEHLTLTEEYAPLAGWLASAYPELFSEPRLFDRLRLFSIAYDVRDLLLHPPPAPAHHLSEHHPVNRLRRTVDGTDHLVERFSHLMPVTA